MEPNYQDILKYGNILSNRNYYGYNIQLVEYDDKLFEKYISKETFKINKIIPCTDNNLNLFIIAENCNKDKFFKIEHNMGASYFEQYFKNYILENQPHLMILLGENEINDRAQTIAKRESAIYDELISEGHNQNETLEIVHENIKEGYKFSLYNLLESLIAENFMDDYQFLTDNNLKMTAIIDFIIKCNIYFAFPDTFEPSNEYCSSLNNNLKPFLKTFHAV